MSVTWPEGGVPPMAFPNPEYVPEPPRQKPLDFEEFGGRYAELLREPGTILRIVADFMRYNDDDYIGPLPIEEAGLAAAIPAQPESITAEAKRPAPTLDQMRRALFMNAITQNPTADREAEWERANKLPAHQVAPLYRAAFPAE